MLLPSIVVFQTNDVVFDAKTDLRLDENERLISIILNAVHVPHVDEAGIPLRDLNLLVISGKDSRALHDNPVLLPVLVLLKRKALPRMDNNTLYAIPRLIQVLFPSPPGTIVGVKKHGVRSDGQSLVKRDYSKDSPLGDKAQPRPDSFSVKSSCR